jgi:hypothetical protein
MGHYAGYFFACTVTPHEKRAEDEKKLAQEFDDIYTRRTMEKFTFSLLLYFK